MTKQPPAITKAELIGQMTGLLVWVEGQPEEFMVDAKRVVDGWVVPCGSDSPWPRERVIVHDPDNPSGPGVVLPAGGSTNPILVALGKLRWVAELYGQGIDGTPVPIPTEAEAAAINQAWTGLDPSAANKALFQEWFRIRRPAR